MRHLLILLITACAMSPEDRACHDYLDELATCWPDRAASLHTRDVCTDVEEVAELAQLECLRAEACDADPLWHVRHCGWPRW